MPKFLTSRSCLPLSYLDLNGENDGVAGTRLFSVLNAHLEANLQGNPSDQPLLIAASGLNDATLFAIERIDAGIYALCRLAGWVTLKALKQIFLLSQDASPLAKHLCHPLVRNGNQEWWHPTATRSISRDGQKPSKNTISGNIRLDMGMPQPSAAFPVEISRRISSSGLQDSSTIPLAMTRDVIGAETSQPVPPDPSNALSMVRAQYQEALYLSRSSLAYFAKGPLSRAKAAFAWTDGLSQGILTLTEFLRSSVLTLPTMDKKYRDTLPEIINALPFGNVSEDDRKAVVINLQKKARKPNKGKIGKDGLYHGEEAYVARWWLSRHNASQDASFSDGGEETLKTLLQEQRARETQLQIILILEVLALESTTPTPGAVPHDATQTAGNEANPQTKKKKPKKPQDLQTLLNLLVDRLSIWQSMRLEESKDSTSDSRPELAHSGEAPKSASANQLKSFCIDVVLPL